MSYVDEAWDAQGAVELLAGMVRSLAEQVHQLRKTIELWAPDAPLFPFAPPSDVEMSTVLMPGWSSAAVHRLGPGPWSMTLELTAEHEPGWIRWRMVTPDGTVSRWIRLRVFSDA